MTATVEDTTRPRGWLDVAEAGSVLGLRIVLWASRLLGRGGARLLLRVIVFYYALFHGTARRASRGYLTRVGEVATFGAVYGHLLCFAQCALDRLYFLQGKHELFEITRNGNAHMEKLRAGKQGAILLGAHLGSFEAMRMRAGHEDFAINVVGYFKHAAKINSVLARAGCNVNVRLVEVEPGSINFVLRLRDMIARGEMVALLADRVVSGDTVEVDFLGGRVRLPTGPFVLAAILKCPVYLTFGLHHAPNRYDLYCEPFADRIDLPRAQRAQALQAAAQRFAYRLEHYCRLAPNNWFNFYDFWNERDVA